MRETERERERERERESDKQDIFYQLFKELKNKNPVGACTCPKISGDVAPVIPCSTLTHG